MVDDNESNIEILVSEISVRHNSRALHRQHWGTNADKRVLT